VAEVSGERPLPLVGPRMSVKISIKIVLALDRHYVMVSQLEIKYIEQVWSVNDGESDIPVEASGGHAAVWKQGSHCHHHPRVLLVQLDAWSKKRYKEENGSSQQK
jgi:hypothetical protein